MGLSLGLKCIQYYNLLYNFDEEEERVERFFSTTFWVLKLKTKPVYVYYEIRSRSTSSLTIQEWPFAQISVVIKKKENGVFA